LEIIDMDKKPYETPVIIPLGDLARGSGQKVPPNNCPNGNSATKACRPGIGGGGANNCPNGTGATKRCTSGSGVLP
jgi:hypothetical protein